MEMDDKEHDKHVSKNSLESPVNKDKWACL